MNRIQTKLVLALLSIALLPVYPVYRLVQDLVQQSLEVGYNQNVGRALDSATQISRELYSQYKQQTLKVAEALAHSEALQQATWDAAGRNALQAQLRQLGPASLCVYDRHSKRLLTLTSDAASDFTAVHQNMLASLKSAQQAEFIRGPGGNRFIYVAAPLPEQRALLLVREVEETFTEGADQVLKANQMFKTLDFYEGGLQQGFLQAFLVIYLPIALISVLIAIFLARRFTRPLLQLAKGTKEVAAGDWDVRIDVDSKDEVGQLGTAFNQMVATLQETQKQIVSLEKMAAWREIARVLAHEIKNPLTPIQLMVQQIKDKYDGADSQYQKLLADSAEIVSDEVENLRTLVREFSEFARMPKLQLEAGNLNKLLEDVGRLYPHDDVQLDLSPELPELNFDSEKMRRVLVNLSENSMDSIREKGSGGIKVSTSIDGNFALIDYADTGNGMPPEAQAKIFEPYFSTKKSGMGLGMAIVKRVIDEHGGKIAMVSEPGQGTRFQIRLPLPA